MSKFIMPRKKKDLEEMLVNAFDMGMQCAYGVEHTEKANDEEILRNRYRALIQGKINGMSDIVNNEKTFVERMSESIF